MADSTGGAALRDFIYLDAERISSIAAQLDVSLPGSIDRVEIERTFVGIEKGLVRRVNVLQVGRDFEFSNWTPEGFADGQFVRATGLVRFLDYSWLSMALSGLPAVLRKMSK